MAAMTLRDEARELQAGVVDLRRELHRNPELGLQLPVTRELVLGALDGLPLDVTLHETTSGVTALLTGGRPGPTVLLRGDMDALPINEPGGLEFASRHEGLMHACGHDAHTAMLVGAARLLTAHRDELTGRVLFMFQPGEEGFHGARHMIEEGLFDVPAAADGSASPITAAFALHVFSGLPTGTVATRVGTTFASGDNFVIRVQGRGGHPSRPYRTIDPVPIAAEIISAIQTMVTRQIDVFEPAVISIGRLQAGTVANVIPSEVEIAGTIRTTSASTRAKVFDALRRLCHHIAEAHGATCEPEIEFGYPVTVNDAAFTGLSLDVARQQLGADRVIEMASPHMGSEDFSYVLGAVPGTMMLLGATPPELDHTTAAPNHSGDVLFDEAALAHGVELYAGVAMRHLGVEP